MKSSIQYSLQTIKRLIFQFNEFKCTIPMGGGLEFVVYERPGDWCNDQELNQLVEDMRTVALAGQDGREIPWYGPLEGRREDLKNRIISVAYDRKAGKPVGFSAQSYLPVSEAHFRAEVVHLGLIYVDPSLQGRSISYILSLFPNVLILIKSGFRDTWVSSVSQVPAVVGLVACNYSDVYPSHQKDSRQSFMHKKLAQLIMRQHRAVFGVGEEASFELKDQIIRNAYTGGSDNMKKSFDQAALHRISKVNEMCDTQLCYERGDDFLQLGKLGHDAVTGLFKNKMKKMSKVHILLNLSLIFVTTSILPVLRWIIPQKKFEEGAVNV